MKKKSISIILVFAFVLSMLPLGGIVAYAYDGSDDDSGSTGSYSKIYFDASSTGWRNFTNITFYLYEHGGSEIITWGSKKGNMKDEGNGIWSFDLEAKGYGLDSSKSYGCIFTADWGMQTCDLMIGSACYGDTAYCTKNMVENNVDSNKHSYEVKWKNADPSKYGVPVCITSIGNVIGTAYWPGETPYSMFVHFLSSEGKDGIDNAKKYTGKTDQQVIDDTSAALGLGIADIEKAIKASGRSFRWSSSSYSPSGVAPRSIKLNATNLTMSEGTTYTLKATITPSTATNQTVYWSSSDPTIAGMGNGGVINAKKPGNVTITAKTSNGLKATCYLTVTVKNPSPTSISVSPTSLNMTAGTTYTLKSTILPANATNKTVYWSSSDPTIAGMGNGGVITAKKTGNVTITAKTVNGLTSTCSLKVFDEINGDPTSYNEYYEYGNGKKSGGFGVLGSYTPTAGAITRKIMFAMPGAWQNSITKNMKCGGYAGVYWWGDNAYDAPDRVAGGNGWPGWRMDKVEEEGVENLFSIDAPVYGNGEAGNGPTLVFNNYLDSGTDSDPSTNPFYNAALQSANFCAKYYSRSDLRWKPQFEKLFRYTFLTQAENCGVDVWGIDMDSNTFWEDLNRAAAEFNGEDWYYLDDDEREYQIDIVFDDNEGCLDFSEYGDYAANFFNEDSCDVTYPKEEPNYYGLSFTFDNMVYVVDLDPAKITVNELSGRLGFSGDVFFYYGDGEYGTWPTMELNEMMGGISGNFTDSDYSASPYDASSVKLNATNLTMTAGTTYTLIATVYPSTAKDKTIYWSSSDPTIAGMGNGGVVTAKKAGSCTITAKTSNGKKATCYVTVKNPVTATGIKLNTTAVTMTAGTNYTLKATISPSNTFNKTIYWSSNNTSVAGMAAGGIIVAKKAGTATITAKTANGKTATCKVTVKSPVAPTGIKLNTTSVTMTAGTNYTLKATISPTNASSKSVSWSSSNTSVAAMASGGIIVAKKAGTATITAKTSNGKTATCKVTVKAAAAVPTGVKLNASLLTMTAGTNYTLKATVSPSNASNKTVYWSSNNSTVAGVLNGGVLVAKKPGTATITAKTSNGKTATCKVTVK